VLVFPSFGGLVNRKPLLVLAVLTSWACVQDPEVERPSLSIAGASTAAPTATPSPSPSPTAAPTPTPAPNPISYVRVAFYGVRCPGGGAPDNLERKLPLGCRGSVTATPKKEDGTDVRPEDHGPDVQWELMHGERIVDVKAVPGQDFNRELVPQRPGPFLLCATVRGVMGCLTAEVTW
jgi:hypothetical protein